MATALAQQLKHVSNNKITKKSTTGGKKKNGATKEKGGQQQSGKFKIPKIPSILFVGREAVEVDMETVYNIGVNGLLELSKFDQRFLQFEKSLFGKNSKSLNRLTLTKEENDRLDVNLNKLLELLTSYFLLKPAHKALEYLLRRYYVGTFNLDALMSCALPYHQTTLFTRLLRTIKVAHSDRWNFFVPIQRNNIVAERSFLVDRCVNDYSLLEFVGNLAKRAIELNIDAKILISFWGTLTLETIARKSDIEDNFLAVVLPFIYSALKHPDVIDYFTGGLMIICQLASKAVLNAEFLKTIINTISANIRDWNYSDTIQCLAHIAQTQPLTDISDKALPSILQDNLSLHLQELVSRGYDVQNLLTVLLKKVSAYQNKEQASSFLLNCIRDLPLTNNHVHTIASTIITTSESQLSDDHPFSKVMRAISARYPEQLDSTLLQLLSDSEGKVDLSVISTALNGTRHTFLEGTQTTVFLALKHPNASFRKIGVDNIISMASSNSIEEEEKSLVSSSILDILSNDSDTELLLYTLTTAKDVIPKLVLKAEKLYNRLTTIINSKLSTAIKSSALAILTGSFVKENPEFKSNVAGVVFSHLLVCHKTKNLNLMAIQATSTIEHELFAPLKNYKPKSESDTEINADIVRLLSAEVTKKDHLAPLFASLAKNLHASTLGVLVLSQALKGGNATKPTVPQALFSIARSSFSDQLANELKSDLLTSFADDEDKQFKEILDDIANTRDKAISSKIGLYALAMIVKHTPKLQHNEEYTELVKDVFSLLISIKSPLPLLHLNVALQHLIQVHFSSSSKDIIRFLEQFFFDSKETLSSILLKSRSLTILSSVFEAAVATKAINLEDATYFATKLFIPLQSGTSELRQSSMEALGSVLNYLQANPSNSVISGYQLSTLLKLFKAIHSFKEEVVSTEQLLPQILAAALSSITKTSSKVKVEELQQAEAKSIQKFLVDIVLGENELLYKHSVLVSLRKIHNKERFESTAPLLWSLLEKCQESALSIVEYEIVSLLAEQIQHCEEYINSGDYMNKIIDTLDWTNERTVRYPQGDISYSVRSEMLVNITPSVFTKLNIDNQTQLTKKLLQIVISSDARGKEMSLALLKTSALPAEVITAILSIVLPASSKSDGNQKRRRRQSSVEDVISEEQSEINCRMITILLEVIHTRTRLASDNRVVKTLFELLGHFTLLNKEDTNENETYEYIKQLIFTTLNNYVFHIVSTPEGKNEIDEEWLSLLDIDLVVQAIRTTTNPQTSNLALLLLSSVAQLQPQKIIDSVMPIFTYMGASALRQDDNYTFHVIQKTIESVLPPVIAKSGSSEEKTIREIIQVFVDTLPYVPQHRRVLLVAIILKTISLKYLHPVILLLFSRHVKSAAQEDSERDIGIADFCQSLVSQFSVPAVLSACTKIADSVVASLLPSHKISGKDASVDLYFEPKSHTTEQLLELSKFVLNFFADFFTSAGFVAQIRSLDNNESVSKSLQACYKNLAQLTLILLRVFSDLQKDTKNKKDISRLKELSEAAYNVIDELNDLLHIDEFIKAITELIQHEDPRVRRRALQLFNEKITTHKSQLSPAEVKLFVDMTRSLLSVISSKTPESVINKQTALFSLEILARNFGSRYQSKFAECVPAVVSCLKLEENNAQVVSSALICLGTLCAELGASILPFLPSFFPLLLGVLDSSKQQGAEESSNLLEVAVLSSIEVVIRAIPQFLSPYYSSILCAVLHPGMLQKALENTQILARIDSILQLLVKVEPRILIPAIIKAHQFALQSKSTNTLVYYLDFIGLTAKHMDKTAITSHAEKVFKFFLDMFDFRRIQSSQSTYSAADIEKIEEKLMSSFTEFVLKLRENIFKPFFLRLLSWAQTAVGNKVSIERSITFYSATSSVCDKLKSIFVPYYGYVLDDAINALNITRDAKAKSSEYTLIVRVIVALGRCFQYDTVSFANKDRFEKVLTPLVNQLEVQEATTDLYRAKADKLADCFVHLAVAVGTDTLWKVLNYQVLLRTRNDAPVIRYAALQIVERLYEKLGEEFVILVPETVPFLAELMEDANPQVEQLTHRVIKTINSFLGDEKIEDYF